MAPPDRGQVLEGVRTFDGRSPHLDPSTRIAGSIKESDNYRLLEELGSSFEPIPWQSLGREGLFKLPDDVEFSFGRKDLTNLVKRNWMERPMGDEGLSCRQRMARAMGVYDWVLAEKPDGILVWTDAYPELRAAVMAGNDLGVPTIEVVHGGFHPLMHGHFEVKKFAKWRIGSWEYRRWSKFYGIEEGVIPCGYTAADVWARADVDVLRQKARHGMEIPGSSPVVCYLEDATFQRTPWSDSGMTDGALRVFLRAFKLACGMVEDLHLILKMHPYNTAESPHQRKDLLKEFGIGENFTIIDDNLPMALAASDLTIGPRSTAMVHGFMLGIPAIVLGFEPFFEAHWYEGFGFKVVREPGDVLSAMVGTLADREEMMRLIDETERGAKYFGSDGLASVRAARVIGKILKGDEVTEADYGSLPN